MANAPSINNNGDKPVGEYSFPTLSRCASPILIPEFHANQWEIRPTMIQLVMKNSFMGQQNPYTHLAFFLELCATFKLLDVPNEVVYLKLFPFSLMGKAREWLYSHAPETFTSWEELANAFLLEFFPPSLTKKFKQQIRGFEQEKDESFYEAHQRFKELLLACPHHNMDKWDLLHCFYDGLTPSGKSHLDLSSGGAFMDLKVKEGFEKIEKVARNLHLWGSNEECMSRVVPMDVMNTCIVMEDFEDGNNPTYEYSSLYEDDEDFISQEEGVIVGKKGNLEEKVEHGHSLNEMCDNELEGFEWPMEEWFEYEDSTLFKDVELEDFSIELDLDDNANCSFESLMSIDEQGEDLMLDHETIEEGFLDMLEKHEVIGKEFLDITLHDYAPYEDIEESCDDENVGFTWAMDGLFDYEDTTLFEDVLLEDDLLESLMSSKQGKDLTFDYGAMVVIVWIRGRRPQILLLVEFRPRLNGREFQWDLKVD